MGLVVLLLALVATQAGAYPNGACPLVCDNGGVPTEPHLGPLSISSNPYSVQFQRIDSESVSVQLIGEAPFKGYFVQAINPDTGDLIGSFQGTNSLICPDGSMAATHSNSSPKISKTVTWLSPPQYQGKVVFRATFVKDLTAYISGVKSNTV